ncbi:hypothetical protein Fmac_029781 [Flemingia macrophylla]|uniref:AP2/ERF domain-containing protein n=1 Tax=Flemingia macrophylla TaxID=520843 RepID=A0ABD1LBC1_9FABA
MSRDWSHESAGIAPNTLMTPRIGTSSHSQESVNNLTNCSTHVGDLESLLQAILDEKHIDECLVRSKLLSFSLGHSTTSRNGREQHDLLTKTISHRSSVYRGVTKAKEDRFEAFVWDKTNPERRGRAGAFANEIDAARAHDMVSIKIGGLNTLTNFPVRCYWRELEEIQSMTKKDYIEAVRRVQSDSNLLDLNGSRNGKGKGCNDKESVYRGVYRIGESRRWEARLCREGFPTINLGVYYTPEDAARAYDIISIKLKGYDAITNFDVYSYEVADIMECVIAQQADGSVVLQIDGRKNETEANPQHNLQNSSLNQNNPQQLRNEPFSHASQNPNLLSGNPVTQGNSSFSHGSQNPNLIPTKPLTLGNTSFPEGSQNPNLISTKPFTLGEFTGGAGTSGNTIVNHGGEFPTSSATLQQPLQTQYQVNFNNGYSQNLPNNNNNQFLPQSCSSSLLARSTKNHELEKCLRFPDWPTGFGQQLLGGNVELGPLSNITIPSLQPQTQRALVSESTGATNGVASFGSGIRPVKPSSQGFESVNGVGSFGSETHPVGPYTQGLGAVNGVGSSGSEIHPVEPSNEEFGEIQLPLPELNQTREPYNSNANAYTLNQAPLHQLNSGLPNGFIIPSPEPIYNASQIQLTENQMDFDMRNYLNRSYIEDNDFACDFDIFGTGNGGKQGV